MLCQEETQEGLQCPGESKRPDIGAIPYPESSGSLARSWSPGETLGNWNFITAGFL